MFYINGKFLSQTITGVQRFAYEIIKELDKIVKPGEFILICPKNANEITLSNIEVKRIGNVKGIIWEQFLFPLYVKRNKGISINLCNAAPLISPDIVCIFDMKIKTNPEFFSKAFVLWYSIQFFFSTKYARLLFTDSYSAKDDILKYYPCAKNKEISVLYPGWQHFQMVQYDDRVFSKHRINKENYYFAMGSLEPNKNLKWILKIAENNKTAFFVIAGLANDKVFADSKNTNKQENVKFVGRVSDEEAKSLMRNCKGFLFPSISEGFGIPPIEAIASGAKQVIVSDISVFHEVLDTQAVFIDPLNYSYKLDFSDSVKDSSVLLNKYSWEKSAQKLYSLLSCNNTN